LRTLLTGMVKQFSMLGAVYGNPSAPSTQSPTATAPSGQQLGAVGSASQETFASLPAMPDFPFAPLPTLPNDAMPRPATPLSLVEALCAETPCGSSVPVSLMGTLCNSPSGEMDFGTVFSFTLRKADGTDLGINVSHHEHDKVLLVEGVRPEGAVEAWNRQCMCSSTPEKAVVPGDKIVSVNTVINEPAKMLQELRNKQLLKFTVMRGGAGGLTAAPPTTPAASGTGTPTTASTPTTLRADASEFVPSFGVVVEEPSATA